MSKSEPLPEGTVIMAEDQYAGRGQQDNTWLAEPGKNLTCSLFLRPFFLPANRQFELNICISTAILNALKGILSTASPEFLTVKWPNDIYYQDKKLGGILLENTISGSHLKHVVAGFGLNVNQVGFSHELQARATSIAQILQGDVEILEILTQICKEIEVNYLALKTGSYTLLRKTYVNNLYKKDKTCRYRQNGYIFEGIIRDVNQEGMLIVEHNGSAATYNFKEIEFLN